MESTKIRLTVASLVLLCRPLYAQSEPPYVQWERVFAGESFSVVETRDGCVVTAGSLAGDVVLRKSDAAGRLVWERTFGGVETDYAADVVACADGGFVVCGATYSFSSGDRHDDDIYVIKTDERGDELWSRSIGGETAEGGTAVVETRGGRFVVLGNTLHGEEVTEIALLEVDERGEIVWSRGHRIDEYDFGRALVPAGDGGYLVAGTTGNFDDQAQDVLAVKVTATGDLVWSRTYGGDGNDSASSARRTADGGFIVTGGASPSIGARTNAFLLKITSSGEEEWLRIFERDVATSGFTTLETADGGFLLAGRESERSGDQLLLYTLEADSRGQEAWSRSRELGYRTVATSLARTAGGDYLLCANTYSVEVGFWRTLLMKLAPRNGKADAPFKRGDANTDGAVDISDPIHVLSYLFVASNDGTCRVPEDQCADAADSNDDGEVDIADAITALDYLFLGRGALPSPGTVTCGPDATGDEIVCRRYEACRR